MIFVGIPAYQAEKTIKSVILDVLSTAHTAKNMTDTYITVVDDGSTDRTSTEAESVNVGKLRVPVITVRHKTNLGYGAAIRTLFELAKRDMVNGDVFVTMDSDGQHHAKDIPLLIAPIQCGSADIVLGSRFLDETKDTIPKVRRIGIENITKLTNKSLGTSYTDAQCGLRAYNRKAVKLLCQESTVDGMGLSTEVLSIASQGNLVVVESPVRCSYGGADSSTQGKITHGADVIGSLFQFILERGSKWVFLSGLLSGLFSLIFGIRLVMLFNDTGVFVLSYGLLMLYTTLVSLILILASINVYTIIRLKELLRLGK